MRMTKKKTLEEQIERSKQVHQGRYDYSDIKEYENNKTKVPIRCNLHGIFMMNFDNHINKRQGCPKCGYILSGDKQRKSNDKFIKECIEMNGEDEYDYSEVEYKGNKVQVVIKHKKCKTIFKQTPSDHLQGVGCPTCFGFKKKTNAQFIEECIEINKDDYDYSKVEYEGDGVSVIIKHKRCGNTFKQSPRNHLRGQGCPNCSSFRTERLCRDILNNLSPYKYTKQKPKWLLGLELDAYNEEEKIALEYNGRQHYKYIPHFHRNGEEDFKKQQERDKRKALLCKKNGVDLITIPYTFNCYNEKELEIYISEAYANINFDRNYNRATF